MNKIIQADSMNRILNEDDLLLLSGVNQYKEKIETECKQLLKKTKIECEMLKQNLHSEYEAKLAEVTQEIRKHNLEQISSYLTKYSDSMHRLVYKILDKLNVLAPNHDNLLYLIKDELWEILNLSELRITTNSANIPFLQEQLANTRFTVTYQADDTMTAGQAIIYDSISTVHVDLEKFKDYLVHLLEN